MSHSPSAAADSKLRPTGQLLAEGASPEEDWRHRSSTRNSAIQRRWGCRFACYEGDCSNPRPCRRLRDGSRLGPCRRGGSDWLVSGGANVSDLSRAGQHGRRCALSRKHHETWRGECALREVRGCAELGAVSLVGRWPDMVHWAVDLMAQGAFKLK